MKIPCWETFRVLKEMGVAIPKEFPEELDVDYEKKKLGIDKEFKLDTSELHIG